MTADSRPERVRPAATREWLALIAALAPIVVAVTRAGATGWVPEYDAGYFTARAHDVFTTDHHPFVGAWSTLGALRDETINNLGPLQLLTIAPLAWLSPYWGTAIAVGLVNALAVVAVWRQARYLFGSRGVLAVMATTGLLELSFGGAALVDPRQQLALLLPFWALLWLTLALLHGRLRALLPWITFASLVLQTHFSYAYITGVLVLIGAAGVIRAARAAPRRAAVITTLAWGALLVVVLWAHTLWDQLFGSGNLARVVGYSGGPNPVGFAVGAQIVAASPLGPPFWWPGALTRFAEPWRFSVATSVLIVVVWTAALLALAGAGRRREPVTTGWALIAVMVLAAAFFTAARSSGSAYGILPQNYFWLWPISLFSASAIGAWVVRRVESTARQERMVLASAAVIGVFALAPTVKFPPWDVAAEILAVGGRPMLEDLDRAVASRDLHGATVVVDDVELRELIPDYYSILGVLARHGVEVHFTAAANDLNRFGPERCEDGTEEWRLRMVVAEVPELTARDDVLIERRGLDAALASELWVAQSTMVSRLSAGDFRVDVDRLDQAGEAGAQLSRILDHPGFPHADLWFYLPKVIAAGLASVPAHLAPIYARWLELESINWASNFTVYLTPNETPTDGCRGD